MWRTHPGTAAAPGHTSDTLRPSWGVKRKLPGSVLPTSLQRRVGGSKHAHVTGRNLRPSASLAQKDECSREHSLPDFQLPGVPSIKAQQIYRCPSHMGERIVTARAEGPHGPPGCKGESKGTRGCRAHNWQVGSVSLVRRNHRPGRGIHDLSGVILIQMTPSSVLPSES